jgi:hypothetical protein
MTNFKSKSDYDVIQIYANGHISQKQDVEQYFYNKYMPLIKKYSKRYENNGFGSFEDNMQECYLIMIDALNNAISKLRENDSFGNMFGGYIRAYFRLKNTNQSYYDYVGDMPEEGQLHCRVWQGRGVSTPDEAYIHKIIYNGFEKALTDYEYTLIELLKAGMKKQTIAKKLGEKNQANLTYHIKRIKKKYINYMNQNGYDMA